MKEDLGGGVIPIERKALGVALQVLRTRRKLTLREIGALADIDHAYVYRLEKGDKHRISPVLLVRLIKTLRCSARDQQIVAWLVNHPGIDPELVRYVLDHEEIPCSVFKMAACLPYRVCAYSDLIAVASRACATEGLSVWCVYDNASDFPGKIVVREWVGFAPKKEHALFGTLLEAREFLRAKGLVHFARHDKDDPAIAETWL